MCCGVAPVRLCIVFDESVNNRRKQSYCQKNDHNRTNEQMMSQQEKRGETPNQRRSISLGMMICVTLMF